MKYLFALGVTFALLLPSVIPARAGGDDSSKYCSYECQYIDGQKVCGNVCH